LVRFLSPSLTLKIIVMFYAIIKNSSVIRVLHESDNDVKDFNLDMGDSIVPYQSPILVKFRSGTTKVGVIRDGMFYANDKTVNAISKIEYWSNFNWQTF